MRTTFADLLIRLEQSVDEIRIPRRKVSPNARTINRITTDWLRVDLTLVSEIELAFVPGGVVKPLFDRLGLAGALSAALASALAPRRSPRILSAGACAGGRTRRAVARDLRAGYA